MQQTPKAIRQAQAANAAAVLKLKRLASLATALMRADAAYEQGLRSWSVVAPQGKTDDQQVAEQMEATRHVSNTDLTRAEGLLAIHLGCLYAVAEKWREWGFKQPIVDQLLANPHLETLEKHRHAVFHADLLDATGFTSLDKEVLDWSKELASAFRAVLRAYWRGVPQFPSN